MVFENAIMIEGVEQDASDEEIVSFSRLQQIEGEKGALELLKGQQTIIWTTGPLVRRLPWVHFHIELNGPIRKNNTLINIHVQNT